MPRSRTLELEAIRRAKISATLKGRTEEQKARTSVKISEVLKGRAKPSFTSEHKANIGKAGKGRQAWNKGATGIKQSEEQKAKKASTLAMTMADPERRAAFLEKCRANGVRSRQAASRRSSSCAEHYIRGYLAALGIDHVWQFPVEGMLADFYIPSMRTIMEYDGSWWHRASATRDADRTARLLAAGYSVVRASEKDLDAVLRNTFQSGVARKDEWA